MPRTTPGSAEREDGPLIATPADPRSTTGLSRRGWTLAIATIAVVAVAAAVLALLAVVQLQDVPAAALTPPAPEATSPEPTAEPGDDAVETAELEGQTVWLATPASAPIGTAVFFPGAADDPAALLKTAAAQSLLAAGWAVSTGEFH